MQPTGANVIGGLIFGVVYIVIMVGMIVGWVYFLRASWRGMKAHESIAASLQRIAEKGG